MPLMGGNLVTILNNGDEFYPSMLEAVRGARPVLALDIQAEPGARPEKTEIGPRSALKPG